VSGSQALLSNTIWNNKIDGFGLVRGTFCAKLFCNANPFQQFRLLLHYLPSASSYTDPSYVAMHNATIATKTTQKHVELDARMTSVTLKMPYIGPYTFFDRKSQLVDWGTFYVSVISPYSSGVSGLASVDVGLYIWFEEFELAAPLCPQSSIKGRRPKNRNVVKLSGEADTKPGPVSTTLRAVSGFARGVADVPMLGTFAKEVSWAADIAAGIASYFGWSRPLLTTAPGVMTRQMNRYSANSDGIDSSYPLALSYSNKLAVTDCCTVVEEDEMSFAYLKTIPSLVEQSPWFSSNATGTSLYNKLISPVSIRQVSTKTVGSKVTTYGTGPPINYLSQHFGMWRGSIKLRISLVKTEFHTGRLQITWTPYSNVGSLVVPTLGTSLASLREIVDISCTNEIELTLPYYNSSNYLPTDVPSGRLDIFVLNDLRQPETCADNINLLFYYSGGPDFEFQAPITTGNITFSPQVGGCEPIVDEVVGGDPSHSLSTMYSSLSVGEHFTSVKQLISRFSVVNSAGSLFGTPPAGQPVFFFWPWVTGVFSMVPGTGAIGAPFVGGDIYSYISPLYAYYRGSMHVALVPSSAASGQPVVIEAFVDLLNARTSGNVSGSAQVQGIGTTGSSSWFLGPAGVSNMGGCGNVVSDHGSNLFCHVPYYGLCHASLCTTTSTPGVINPRPNDTTQAQGVLKFYYASNTNATSLSVLRAAGDDFQFCNFVSTVPYLITYV
jgi:hypothetical protein